MVKECHEDPSIELSDLLTSKGFHGKKIQEGHFDTRGGSVLKRTEITASKSKAIDVSSAVYVHIC